MATWTAVSSDSWFRTACWVCDMGPLIAPVTINPDTGLPRYLISVDYLPSDADELDFIIGRLTPDDLRAGSMGSLWADAGRYHSGTGTERTFPVDVELDSIAPDPHLYVVWYDPAYPDDPAALVPPSVKPEQVVPCIYVRGGRGPYFGPGVTVPAHWSDWQPGFVASSGFVQGAWDVPGQRFCASLDTNAGAKDPANYYALSEGTQYVHPPQSLPLPDRNLIELGAESLARQRAGAAADDLFYLGGIDQVFGWKLYRIGSDSYPYDPTYQLHHFETFTRIDQRGEVFVMPDAGSLPSPPGSFTTYEWEGSPTGTVQLRDQSVDIVNRGGFDWPGYQNFQSGTPLEHTATETFEIWAIPGTGPGANSIRVDPSTTGIKLLEFELSTHLHADHSVSYDPAQTLTIPYSMIPTSWAHFTLVYQPRLFHSGDGASLWYDMPAPDPTGPENGTFRAYQYGIVPDGWIVSLPYDIHTPRWRYQIPETYTPGALRCCPNQKLKVSPGVPGAPGHWSDWQPAVEATQVVPAQAFHRANYGSGYQTSEWTGDASQAAAVADVLAQARAGAGWTPTADPDHRDFQIEVARFDSTGGSAAGDQIQASIDLGYVAATFRATTAPAVPTLPVPSGAGDIPADQRNGHEVQSNLVQLEGVLSFQGWADALFEHYAEYNFTDADWDAPNHSYFPPYVPTGPPTWTPPTAHPVTIGVTDPMDPAAHDVYFWSGTDPRWYKRGPKVLYSDLEVLTETTFNAQHATASTAPYSYNPTGTAQETLTDTHSVAVPLSGVTRQELALVFMDGYLNPAHDLVIPPLGYFDRALYYGWHSAQKNPDTEGSEYVMDFTPLPPMLHEHTTGAPSLVARWSTGRWRYWIPETPAVPPVIECSGQPPYLRMTQRNDGLGISPHPQLGLRSTSSNNPGVAPRIGRAARYD